MVKGKKISARWQAERKMLDEAVNAPETGYEKFKKIVGYVVMLLYRLRKVFLAIPVVYLALKLAVYNLNHLPEQVGVNLQSSGAFANMISRQVAVMTPLGVTAACLVLMFASRKALYPWAVSLFTLLLPILLLVSNLYPA